MRDIMIDGVCVATVDEETATLLKRLSSDRPGRILASPELRFDEYKSRDIQELARGALVRRAFSQDIRLSLELAFAFAFEKEVIQNTRVR